MRRTISLVLFVGAVLALNDVSAQSIAKRSFILPEIGIASATGDIAEPVELGGIDAGSGPSGGVSFVRVFSQGAGGGLRWRYIRIPVRNLKSGSVHVSGHMLDASGYFMLASKGPVIPFVNAGVMFGKTKIAGETDDFPYIYSSDRVSGSVSIDWALGVVVGAGILNPMGNRVGLYLAGEYGYLGTDGSEADVDLDGGSISVPKIVKIPLNADWFTVKAGLMIFVGS